MTLRVPAPATSWIIDPDDPRAPPEHVWEAMSPAERRRIIDTLPSEFPAAEARAEEEARLRKEADQLRKKEARRRKEEVRRRKEAERLGKEAERLGKEEARLRAEEARLRAEADARLASALAEIERLKAERRGQ